MTMYLGDFAAGSTVHFKWNTFGTTGASITRATDGTIKIYKDGSTTERSSAAGVTDTEDFDSRTGVHLCSIDLSDNTDAGFYAAAHEYSVYITAATIDGQVVNAVLAHFSIANRVVASVTGAVGSVTGAVGSVTGAVGSVTGNVGGNVTGTVGSVVGAVGSVTGNVGGNVVGTVASVTGAVGSVTGAVGSVTGNVGGNVVGSVASLTANNDKTGYALSATGSAALTEGYAADGATATLPQLLYMILAMLTEFSISSTTGTAKKLDGSTTAATFTLDSATAPTSITRAS